LFCIFLIKNNFSAESFVQFPVFLQINSGFIKKLLPDIAFSFHNCRKAGKLLIKAKIENENKQILN